MFRRSHANADGFPTGAEPTAEGSSALELGTSCTALSHVLFNASEPRKLARCTKNGYGCFKPGWPVGGCPFRPRIGLRIRHGHLRDSRKRLIMHVSAADQSRHAVGPKVTLASSGFTSSGWNMLVRLEDSSRLSPPVGEDGGLTAFCLSLPETNRSRFLRPTAGWRTRWCIHVPLVGAAPRRPPVCRSNGPRRISRPARHE